MRHDTLTAGTARSGRRPRALLAIALGMLVGSWLAGSAAPRDSASPLLGRDDESIGIPLIAAEGAGRAALETASDAHAPRREPFSRALRRTLREAAERPADAAAQLAKIEALLAGGRAHEAELAAADYMSVTATTESDDDARQQRTRALRLWTTARLRQGQPLAEPALTPGLSAAADEPALAAVNFWHSALAGRAPYRIAPGAEPTTVPLQRPLMFSQLAGRKIDGVAATIGGERLPLVFIDSGAQQTFLSTSAARAAGVLVAEQTSEMVGFASFSVLPGLIPELQIGELVIHDVPVFVGDSPALMRAKGQMAIGTDLMHHLRITIDDAAGAVTFEPSRGAAPLEPLAAGAGWDLQLWPFPQVCLAEATVDGQHYARVLVDTGNWEGTYVSARWARVAEVELAEPAGRRRAGQRAAMLSDLDLGGASFGAWPVRSALPAELDRLDLIDILVGHDLLAGGRVTIDLAARRLRCERNEP